MKGSLYIGRLAGIKLFIHWTFLLLVIWVVFSSISQGLSTGESLNALLFIFAVFGCITLHELGHALAAKRFHFQTRDIILLPIGGMARMDEFPENPRQELIIAIAGPAVNFVIALLLYPFVVWLGQVPSFFTLLFEEGNSFLFNLMAVNLVLAVFNLIPAFPMDGGRILRAILSMFMDRVRATDAAAKTGQVIALAFFFLGIFYNPFLALVGVFIFLLAQAENEYVRSKHLLRDLKVRDVVMHQYHTLDAQHHTVNDAVKLLLDVQVTDFLVMEGQRVAGTLSKNNIIRALSENKGTAPVSAVMNTGVPLLEPEMPLDKVFGQLRQKESALLPVVQGDTLLGVVDLNNILELILVRSATEKGRTKELSVS